MTTVKEFLELVTRPGVGTVVPSKAGEPAIVIVDPDAIRALLRPGGGRDDGRIRDVTEPLIATFRRPLASVGELVGVTNQETYQDVVVLAVGGSLGHLYEIGLTASDNAFAEWRLLIDERVQFEDKVIRGDINLPFGDTDIRSGASVRVQGRSTDGTAVTLTGTITASEDGP